MAKAHVGPLSVLVELLNAVLHKELDLSFGARAIDARRGLFGVAPWAGHPLYQVDLRSRTQSLCTQSEIV